MNNTRICLGVIACVGLQACGGGGGDDAPNVCRAYCESACAKTANCGFLAPSNVGVCADGCYQRILDNNGNNDTCSRGAQVVLTATCNQLGTLLGFRMQTRMDQDDLSLQFETGSAIAQFVEEPQGQ